MPQPLASQPRPSATTIADEWAYPATHNLGAVTPAELPARRRAGHSLEDRITYGLVAGLFVTMGVCPLVRGETPDAGKKFCTAFGVAKGLERAFDAAPRWALGAMAAAPATALALHHVLPDTSHLVGMAVGFGVLALGPSLQRRMAARG